MFDAGKTRMIGLPYGKKYDDMLSRFHLIPERYGQTDRRTDRFAIPISRVSMLTRDKNWQGFSHSFYSVQTRQRTTVMNFSLKQTLIQQELSYRQQIARQLRTHYAEDIYRHKYYTVTLKLRSNVTQDHWKRNHWIDHTQLSSSRVIWRWILLWPWNVG